LRVALERAGGVTSDVVLAVPAGAPLASAVLQFVAAHGLEESAVPVLVRALEERDLAGGAGSGETARAPSSIIITANGAESRLEQLADVAAGATQRFVD
jgi:hypothetical protein